MSKQSTPDGPAPKLYDTEKIIDIHSPEWDPSLDSQKVREVKSYIPQTRYIQNGNNNTNDKSNSDAPDKAISSIEKSSHTNESNDVDVYDYHGKLR